MPSPTKPQKGSKTPIPVNRRLVEEPVVLGDDTEGDGGGRLQEQPTKTVGDTGVDRAGSGTVHASIVSGSSQPQFESVPVPRRTMAMAPAIVIPPAQTPHLLAAWSSLVNEGIQRLTATNAAPVIGSCSSPIEPPGTIGKPDLNNPCLLGPVNPSSNSRARQPHSFSFTDVVALGRRDAERVNTFIDTDAAWALSVRQRFLSHCDGGYQLPNNVISDRSFSSDPLIGVYLESGPAFVTGTTDVPPYPSNARFWDYDLPLPSPAGLRTQFDLLRTQWTVTRGFGHIITFADHDTFRIDESPATLYDVVTAKGDRQTAYRIPIDRFSSLPSW